MIDEQGYIKIIDFGEAKMVDSYEKHDSSQNSYNRHDKSGNRAS